MTDNEPMNDVFSNLDSARVFMFKAYEALKTDLTMELDKGDDFIDMLCRIDDLKEEMEHYAEEIRILERKKAMKEELEARA